MTFAEEQYKEFIQRQSCVVPECRALGSGHHLRGKGLGGGIGLKPSHLFRIPMCDLHHSEIHAIGVSTFEKKYGLYLIRELLFFLEGFIRIHLNGRGDKDGTITTKKGRQNQNGRQEV